MQVTASQARQTSRPFALLSERTCAPRRPSRLCRPCLPTSSPTPARRYSSSLPHRSVAGGSTSARGPTARHKECASVGGTNGVVGGGRSCGAPWYATQPVVPRSPPPAAIVFGKTTTVSVGGCCHTSLSERAEGTHAPPSPLARCAKAVPASSALGPARRGALMPGGVGDERKQDRQWAFWAYPCRQRRRRCRCRQVLLSLLGHPPPQGIHRRSRHARMRDCEVNGEEFRGRGGVFWRRRKRMRRGGGVLVEEEGQQGTDVLEWVPV